MLNWSNNVVQSALIATVFRRRLQPPPPAPPAPPAPPPAASVLRNEAHGQLAFSRLPLTNLKRTLLKATRKVDLFETR